MSATYNALAIVLRREPFRDSARIYTVFTREHGKLLAIGRGTRKLLSKLGPHLEPYSLTELHLARGRKYETLCGAVMRRSPEPLATDETRHAAAAFVAEAVDHFVKWGDRDERLWELLDGFFSDIENVPAGTFSYHVETFVWGFMDTLGYRPKLEACAGCEGDLGFAAIFLPARGVALCAGCRPEERHLTGAVPLDGDRLATGLAFLEAHLDRPLMSLPILREALIPERKSATVPF